MKSFPEYATPFIGREEDIQKIISLTATGDCRLVTLVGAGGSGKTRIAIELARRLHHRYTDGVIFIELQLITDIERLSFTLAEAAGGSLQADEPPVQQLIDWLQDRQVLFVLDNFEHIIESVHLLSEMISQTQQVDFLVTSREVLNMIEEWVYPIEGLPFPASTDADLEDYDAVQLFTTHARRIQPYFAFDHHAKSVVDICQVVQGMPLALEIAASWLRSLLPGDILREIQQSLDFLATTLRNMPERHQSMRAVFEQSWQLLPEQERLTLARLSVFRTGFDRAAAQAIANATLAQLTRLVEKSLLYFDQQGRYMLHELLRQFASEKPSTSPITWTTPPTCWPSCLGWPTCYTVAA